MTRYPANWQLLRVQIRDVRARNRCECTGECGIHRPNPGVRRCVEIHHTPARWFRGKVRLTLAHLCPCDPPCGNPEHIKAMCQRCHLRLDRWKHARTRHKPRTATTSPPAIPTYPKFPATYTPRGSNPPTGGRDPREGGNVV